MKIQDLFESKVDFLFDRYEEIIYSFVEQRNIEGLCSWIERQNIQQSPPLYFSKMSFGRKVVHVDGQVPIKVVIISSLMYETAWDVLSIDEYAKIMDYARTLGESYYNITNFVNFNSLTACIENGHTAEVTDFGAIGLSLKSTEDARKCVVELVEEYEREE